MNVKTTRKAFFSSVVALILCFATLMGSTFAWFTDTVTSEGNVIQAGSLKVDLLHKSGEEWISIDNNADHKIFDYQAWEPGQTKIETLKAQNLGSLALQYKLAIQGEVELGDNGENLAEKIFVYVTYGDEVTETSYEAIKESTAWGYKGTLAEVMADPNAFVGGQLLPADAALPEGSAASTAIGEQTITVALHFDENAGDEYQNRAINDIYVTLVATQWSYEDGAFGNEYDALARFPLFPGKLTYVTAPVTVSDSGETTAPVQLGTTEDMVSATVPEGVKL